MDNNHDEVREAEKNKKEKEKTTPSSINGHTRPAIMIVRLDCEENLKETKHEEEERRSKKERENNRNENLLSFCRHLHG